jgi:hypothetical protein
MTDDRSSPETEILKLEWRNGAPPKPWSGEWFIAETTYGDRVVLTSLPEKWTYDFKTADDTYIMRDKIKRWMQFPDSEFIAPEKSDLAQCPDLVAAVRGAFPHFQEGAPITPEAIKSIGKEYLEMVMGWEPQKTEIEFADDDGNIRKIVYKPGEYEAGSFPGWVLSDDASPDTSTDRADK